MYAVLMHACCPDARMLQAFKDAMRIAGITDPRLCIFADDSVKNIVTAKNMGWTTVLVGNLDRDTQQPLVCDEADHIIATIHELPRVMPELFHEPAQVPSLFPAALIAVAIVFAWSIWKRK